MAYIPTNWENREVEKPRTYTMTDNGDGTITLTPAEGQIFVTGTPLDASTLNHMEAGIENSVQKTGDNLVFDGEVIVKKNIMIDAIGYDLIFEAGRPNNTRLFWNADLVNDYGLNFLVDGQLSTVMHKDKLQANLITSINESLELMGNNGVIKLKSPSGDWLSVVGNVIQNPSGDGNLVLTAGDGSGLLILKAPTNSIRMQIGNDGLRVANADFNGYMPVFASEFTNASKRELKKNIVDFTGNGEEIVNSALVRNFNYKTENDSELPHTGLIVEEAPVEVINPKGEGIDLYAMGSVAWKAIQEMSAKITALETRITELETV